MKPSRVAQYIERNLTNSSHRPMLLAGAPGVGKTSLCRQAADAVGAHLIVTHLVYKSPEDMGGLPWPDKDTGTARFLPIGDFAKVLAATERTLWVLDDFGQAAGAVQAAAMPLLLDRGSNGHRIPDCVSVIATTNRAHDRAGVTAMLEPVKSRFQSILTVEPSLDDTCAWALATGKYRPEVIAFLRLRPDLLWEEKAAGGMANGPNPRTWENASSILEDLRPDPEDELEILAGAVGEGAATELVAFLATWRSMVSVDRILMDPHSAPLPAADRPDQQYATATACAYRTTPDTYDVIATYLLRLQANGMGPFAALALKDAVRRRPEIEQTQTHLRVCAGPLGQLFTGEAS